MQGKFRILIASLMLFLWIFSACRHEPDIVGANPPMIANNCNSDTVYFRTELLPLLVSSCAVSGCHNAESQAEGVQITDYASVMREVKPGQASKSKLYKLITRSIPGLRMPPAPRQPLNPAFISKIEKWINQGASNNFCPEENCDTLNVSFSAHILPVVQNYCHGCHSGAKPSGNLKLTNYSEIVDIAMDGRFLGAVQWLSGYKAMPKDGDKLSDCKIRQIALWIEAGTPEN